MELYTSLTELKRVLNGGQLPVYTPLSDRARQVIDPSLMKGAGCLIEDEERGLLCPIRGCGKWTHAMASHISTSHRSITVAAFKEAAGYAPTARLISQKAKAVRAAQERARGARPTPPPATAAARKKQAESLRLRAQAMGTRNFRNQCVAQLTHRLLDLANEIGRSPSSADATAKFGPGFVAACQRVFGTWDNAKAQCGLPRLRSRYAYRKQPTTDEVLEGLAAWYHVHGDLPSVTDTIHMERTPTMHQGREILIALGCTTWEAAMHRAARLLKVRSAKYTAEPAA